MSDPMDKYENAILTVEGSTVANHMLRELMTAMGKSLHARPQTPGSVWDECLAEIRTLSRQEVSDRHGIFSWGEPDEGDIYSTGENRTDG